MTSFIKIKAGAYRNKDVSGQVFQLVAQYKSTPKGGYVLVKNGNKFPGFPVDIKIKVDGPHSYTFVEAGEFGGEPIELDMPQTAAAPVEPDEVVMARIAERFEILHDMTKAACAGTIRAMIVTGPPGVGKSFGVEQELEKAALFDRISGKRVKSEVVKGAATPIGLYQKLYQFSDSDCVLVFDDCDMLFYDDLSLNLLKAALDTGKKRRISWNSESSALKKEEIPNSFDFNGSVIFITNLKFENIKSKKLQDHLAALESRCHYLDLTLDTTRDKLLRIKQIVATGELFQDYDFSQTQQDEIIEFLFDNSAKLREVSLRTAIKIADLYQSFALKWKAMASITVMRSN